jgi:hypothetical protein
MPYRTQSDDTTADADVRQFAIWRAMSREQKLQLWADMQSAAWQLSELGIRLRHPAASEREVFLRRVALTLDAGTMRRVYGWDPQ